MTRARVLVADDNKAIREVLNSTLAEHFDVIQAVSDGGAALTAVKQLMPDIVVLDISMPVLNGIEVARRIKETGPQLGVVLLTCFRDSEIFRAACEAGVSGYVVKARSDLDLVPAIHLALRGTRFVSPGVDNA